MNCCFARGETLVRSILGGMGVLRSFADLSWISPARSFLSDEDGYLSSDIGHSSSSPAGCESSRYEGPLPVLDDLLEVVDSEASSE